MLGRTEAASQAQSSGRSSESQGSIQDLTATATAVQAQARRTCHPIAGDSQRTCHHSGSSSEIAARRSEVGVIVLNSQRTCHRSHRSTGRTCHPIAGDTQRTCHRSTEPVTVREARAEPDGLMLSVRRSDQERIVLVRCGPHPDSIESVKSNQTVNNSSGFSFDRSFTSP